MAQRNGDDTVHRTDFEAYSRYKQEPDNYQQPMAEGSTYQSPIPYPSPQLQNSYAYTPLQDPSLQLPPIKSVEGYNPTQSQYQPALQSGMDRDSQQTAYYPAAGQTHQYPPPPSVDAMSSGQAQAMRHPLQPALNPEDRMMSDKHRKEIKRRTKTGCLTCRKRRIKCDETHPVCRNCQKSKRECAGYDPLFRQQSSPQSLHASVGPDSSSRTTPVASTPEAVNYTSVPHGYAPATNQRYGHRSATSYSPPSSAGHNYEYQTAIDPALAGGDSVNMPSAGTSVLTDGVRLKSETSHENGSPHAPGNEAGQSIIEPGKRMLKMDDLYMIGGADPPTPNFTEPLSAEKLDQIKYVYTNEYAKGIDHFLETYWYTYDGLDRLMADSQLCELFAGMLELFGTTKSDNYDTLRLIPLTESRVTWLLMCLARTEIPNTSSSSTSEPPPPPPPTQSVDPTILHRLSIFEHLITNRTLPSNPLSDPFNNYNNNNNPPSPTDRCAQFWRELGQYTTYLPSQTAEIDASLARLRLLLDMIENRDVLYSIAIVRRLGPACDGLLRGDHDAAMSASVSEEDRSKLLVAKKFIEDEAAGKGTTQVVQRVCGMAVRSWVWLR